MSIVNRMAENLKQAAQKFREYEALHRAKGTEESLAKAEVNEQMARTLEETLHDYYTGKDA